MVDAERLVLIGMPLTNLNGVRFHASLQNGGEAPSALSDAAFTTLFVGVEWLANCDLEDAVWEKGMFANQDSAC